MSDIDELVRHTVASITTIADKAGRFAGKMLIVSLGICGLSFYLGVQALSGGIESVWIVLGIVFGAIAVGGPLVALWRAGSVKRHIGDIADEVRTVAATENDPSKTVVETFVVGDPEADPNAGSAIVMSRQMHGFRAQHGSSLDRTEHLGDATKALAAFPFQMIVTFAVTGVFAFLGFIFLIALAL